MGKLKEFVENCVENYRSAGESSTKGQTEVILEKFAEHMDNEGVGSSDWNTLQNKPFYDNQLVSVTVEGFPHTWYKVSSDVPANTPSDGTKIYVWLNGEMGSPVVRAYESAYTAGEAYFWVALTDNVQVNLGKSVVTLPERGTYFMNVGDATVTTGINSNTYVEGNTPEPEISWDGNTGETKQLDEKFIPEMTSVILKSSTADSTKRFKITVDDSGTISATEVTT